MNAVLDIKDGLVVQPAATEAAPGEVHAMSMIQGLNSAMDVMLERDPNVVIFGEDVGYFGGVFRCTEGLQQKYGEDRVFDTPIAEGGIVATAIGMGVNGLRPVVEIQFADYIYPAFDQIASELARLRYRSAGQFWSPVTIRTPCGGGIRGGQTHSQTPEALFAHVCGLKTVMPSNPYDAKGLLISAIEDNDPVIFFEPKRLYNGPFDGDPSKPAVSWDSHEKGQVPAGHYRVPLGKADIGAGRKRRNRAGLRYHGARGAGGERRRNGHRCRSNRRAHPDASGHRNHLRLRVPHRALRDRTRSHALLRLWSGTLRTGAGALLLEPGGAHRAGDGLGHALPSRPGMGVFSGPGAGGGRAETGTGCMSMAEYSFKRTLDA